jgi:hypothetical protein
MDELERKRAVADAILLERAAGVLERREPDMARKFQLRAVAARFRREAEVSAPFPVVPPSQIAGEVAEDVRRLGFWDKR